MTDEKVKLKQTDGSRFEIPLNYVQSVQPDLVDEFKDSDQHTPLTMNFESFQQLRMQEIAQQLGFFLDNDWDNPDYERRTTIAYIVKLLMDLHQIMRREENGDYRTYRSLDEEYPTVITEDEMYVDKICRKLIQKLERRDLKEVA